MKVRRPDPNHMAAIAERIKRQGGKAHLLNDMGIYKSSLKRAFENNYIHRIGEGDEHAAIAYELLTRRGQFYTLEEVKHISGYMTSSHDACVTDNPDEYSPVEVYQSEQNEMKHEYISIAIVEIEKYLNFR